MSTVDSKRRLGFCRLGFPRLSCRRGLALVVAITILVGMPRFAVAQQVERPKIERRLPPAGIEIDSATSESLQNRLNKLQAAANELMQHELIADVTCLLKSVDFALRHGEFYRKGDTKKAETQLDLAATRLEELAAGTSSWTKTRGLVVRGFVSKIDGSPQPYGLVIPKDLDLGKDNRLYVWLHGRGDKTTDLHFIDQRLKSAGQVTPDDAIVVHPLGRQCIGYKSAGEIDVLEVVDHVAVQYGIDRDRVVLMGFSMGGAGVWHLGAHYADQWAAMSPGAGFAETALYNRLTPADYPAWYERELWKVYDVPNYVRNLFNLPVVVYSGENDKQIQAARVMEQAFAAQGRELTHLIGPGMGHKYHPEVLQDIKQRMRAAADIGRNNRPKTVHLQTTTLRYGSQFWVHATRLKKHWEDSRIDAEVKDEESIHMTTRNIAALSLTYWQKVPMDGELTIDGQIVSLGNIAGRDRVDLVWRDEWILGTPTADGLAKIPGLQGPMDDVFLTPFLVVLPDERADDQLLQEWLDFEIQHLRERWPALFRGELPVKRASEVTETDRQTKSLVLWGTPKTNPLIRQAIVAGDGGRRHGGRRHGGRRHGGRHRVPLQWSDGVIQLDGETQRGSHLVPSLVYPSPWSEDRYVLINSGPTFREGHDRTNSLQNPKLPDWAIIDIRTPSSDTAPGRIANAGFFNEFWRREGQ
jgi:predicted esterase